MGRGRQRAKQAKVARELKYFSPDTDYAALQRELGGGAGEPQVESAVADDEAELDDAELDEADDDYDWTAERR
jgi:hypothetical protein